MTRALLVDLDGTLVDTDLANFTAYASALKEVGVTVSKFEFEKIARGRNWRQFLPIILENVAVSPETVARRKTEIYPTLVHLTAVNEGVAELVAIARSSCPTALVTTASAQSTQTILSHHKLNTLFDVVVTGSDVTHHKPDPEAYWFAAKRLGVEPHDCIAIEDSDAGVASARAFGAAVVRVSLVNNPATACTAD